MFQNTWYVEKYNLNNVDYVWNFFKFLSRNLIEKFDN